MSILKLLSSGLAIALALLSTNVHSQIVRPAEDPLTRQRTNAEQIAPRVVNSGATQLSNLNQQLLSPKLPPIVQKSATAGNANEMSQGFPSQHQRPMPPIVSADQTVPNSGTLMPAVVQPHPLAPKQASSSMPLPAAYSPVPSDDAPVATATQKQMILPGMPAENVGEVVAQSPLDTAANPLQPIEDGQVQPATAQWPVSQNPRQNYSTTLPPVYPASSRTNMIRPGYQEGDGESNTPALNTPPIVSGNGLMPNTGTFQDMPAEPNMGNVPPVVNGQPSTEPTSVIEPGSGNLLPPMQTRSPQIDPVDQSTPTLIDNNHIHSPSVYGTTSQINGSCPSCGNAACNGSCNNVGLASPVAGCNTCGVAGCNDPNAVASQFNCSGSVAGASRYFVAEALYWKLEDSDFRGTNAGGLGDFDGELGWRFQWGRRANATEGDEFGYMGSAWDNRRLIVDPASRLSSNFLAGIPFTAPQVAPFFNASRQVETRDLELHSFEYNQVKWGWDVIKTFRGIRINYLDDEYNLKSSNATSTGDLNVNASNFMIGPQWGGELFYDVGYRTSYSLFGKFGAYANFMNLDTQFTTDGTSLLDRGSDQVNISGSLELGLLGHYQLTPAARLRFGYNLLWFYRMATSTDNFPRVLDSNAGSSLQDSEDLFFHGLNFGIEIFR